MKEGKLRLDLLPVRAIEEIAKAFQYGLTKYPAWGWLTIDEWQDYYFAATLRHLFDWRKGITKDAESKLHPLAHAGANVIILLTRSNNDYLRPGRNTNGSAFCTMPDDFDKTGNLTDNGPSENLPSPAKVRHGKKITKF